MMPSKPATSLIVSSSNDEAITMASPNRSRGPANESWSTRRTRTGARAIQILHQPQLRSVQLTVTRRWDRVPTPRARHATTVSVAVGLQHRNILADRRAFALGATHSLFGVARVLPRG